MAALTFPLPFIGATYRRPRGTMPPTLIVLHSGETGEGGTAAEGMANYFARPVVVRGPGDVGSAHVCVDSNSAVRCAWDNERTNGAGGVNAEALHIEQAGRAAQLGINWNDEYSRAVVENAAFVARDWLDKYRNIKPVFLNAAALARGTRNGITTHHEVTQAGFAGNGGHWDPGPHYPIARFIALCRGSESPSRKVSDMDVLTARVDGVGRAWLTIGGWTVREFPRTPTNEFGVPKAAVDYANARGMRVETVSLEEINRINHRTVAADNIPI